MKSIKYTGIAPLPEEPITGSKRVWDYGQIQTVDDSVADQLLTTGLFEDGAGDYVTAITDPVSGAVKYSTGNTVRKKKNLTLTNVYGSENSERLATGNSNTTPVVTYGNALPANKFGILTGSIVGTSGNAQQNLTTPSDTAYYVYSFFAYVQPGVTGAKVESGVIGFNGGTTRSFSYDWDAPLTASVGVYPLAGTGLTSSLAVDNLGCGFRRFHIVIKNTNKNLFIDQFTGSAATNKVILSGFQLVRIPDDGTSTRIDEYVPLGIYNFPYDGSGKSGVMTGYAKRFPFRDVAVFSDSIWGAAAEDWRLFDSLLNYFAIASINSYGGYTTEQICAQFDLQNTNSAFEKSLVIFNCGRNDGLHSDSNRATVLAALDRRIQALGHTNYKVCGVLLRYTCTASPGAEETTNTNPESYAGIMAYNAMLSEKYGEKFIDFQSISMGAYNPLDTADISAVAIGMRPPSLAPATGDGLHPNATENKVIGAAVVESIKAEYL